MTLNNSDDVETSRRWTREECDFPVHDTWIALHCFFEKLHFSNALAWGVLWICRKTVSVFAKPLLHDHFDAKMSEADEDSYKPKVASQSETKSHIYYCVAAKSRITRGHTSASPNLFLTHAHTIDQLRLLQISHTTMMTTKITSPLLLCMLLSRTSDFEGEQLVQKCFHLCTNKYSIYFGAAWNRLDTFGAYDQSYTFAQPAAQTARWSFIV